MKALYRTYRPATFAEVTGQEHVKSAVLSQLRSGRVAHAYLFMGPRGVGKTTIARLIAKAVNCEHPKDGEPCDACGPCKDIAAGTALDVHEIDAASHTDVENVRENVIRSVRMAPSSLKRKVFIIDEVHMLSTSSFNALLKTLEEPPEHALFVLATTEIHKVPDTVISRCQRFDFRRVPVTEIAGKLERIAREEGVAVAPEVLERVAWLADGCVRDAESLLGQVIALGEKQIDMETALLVLPITDMALVADLLEATLVSDAPKALRLVNEYVTRGVDMRNLIDRSVEALRAMLFGRLGGIEAAGSRLEGEAGERLLALAPSQDPGRLTSAIEAFLDARGQVKAGKIPQLPVELAIMRVSQARPPAPGGPPSDFREQEVASDIPAAPAPAPASEPVAPPEPSPDPAPAPGGDVAASAIDFEAVRRKWNQVENEARATGPALALILQHAELAAMDKDVVELRFPFALHADNLNKQKHHDALCAIMGRVYGCPLRVKGVHAGAEADDMAAALVQEFGGSIA